MAVIEKAVLLTSKNESGEKRLIYPITRADCVDGLEELIDEKIDAESVSWNDLNDRPFGENTDGTVKQLDNKFLSILDGSPSSEIDILSKQDVQFIGGEGNPADIAVLVAGETYRVVWDTDEYVLEAKNVVFDGIDGVGIGNTSLIGVGEDTGEEFVLGYAPEYGINVFITQSAEDSTHSVRIYQSTPASYKVKEEYLSETSIPEFNLIEMGLPALRADGEYVIATTDTSTIRAALDKGPAKFILMESNGVTSEITGFAHGGDGVYALDNVINGTTVRRIYIVSDGILAKDINLESALPDVTTDDNGKVLAVSDGKWAAQDVPAALPEVTTADEGKVLSVKDGVWAATTAPVTEGGGVSTETEILAEQSLPFVASGISGLYLFESLSHTDTYPNPKLCTLVAGETYFVDWDGVTYTCVATVANFNGETGVGLGNFAMAGLGDDTGEPFLFGVFDSGENTACYTTDTTSEAHTVRIYQKEPISWNTLADRPFDQTAETVFEGTLQDTYDETNATWNGIARLEDTSDTALIVGQTYTYTWEGQEYVSVCGTFTENGLPCIGNAVGMGGTLDDQPVLIVRDVDGSVLGAKSWAAMMINTPTDSSLSGAYPVKITTTVTNYLDNKYLSILEKTVSKETEILPETSVTFTEGQASLNPAVVLAPGATCRVIWDGVEYTLVAKAVSADGMDVFVVGNGALGGAGDDTGEPFCIGYVEEYNMTTIIVQSTEESTHTVQIFQTPPEIYTLKEEHIGNVDYETKVINKPFGQLAEAGAIVADRNVTYDSTDFGFLLSDFDTFESYVDDTTLVEGATYSVEIAGVTYDGVGATAETIKQSISSFESAVLTGVGIMICQDGNVWGALAELQGVLWFIMPNSTESYTNGENYQIKITVVEAIKKIDAMYLPMDAIKAYIDECIGEALRGTY